MPAVCPLLGRPTETEPTPYERHGNDDDLLTPPLVWMVGHPGLQTLHQRRSSGFGAVDTGDD